MQERNVALAKITRPSLSGVLARGRLFQKLDRGGGRPVTWVAAPAGAGKTTLVASWLDSRNLPCLWYQVDEGDLDPASFFYHLGLAAKKATPRSRKPLPLFTPEYLLGMSTFTKRYFEDLYSKLMSISLSSAKNGGRRSVKIREKSRFILVFDNCQDLPEDSGFYEIMKDALSVITDAVRVVVISRSCPTRQFVRFSLEKKMEVIGWEDIRFTLEESEGLVLSGRKDGLPRASIEQLHTQAGGWAAGLMLMSWATPRDDLPGGHTRSELFDYFAGELFDKADPETRNFLLRTSFLPILTGPMAIRLTGFGKAGHLLAELRRNHFFITSNAESVYQYHPLFREFLTSRAGEIFTEEELAAIRRSAASILKDSGRAEDAIELFREAGDWQSLIGLALEKAPALAGEGRLQTLSEWLAAVPEPIFAGSPRLWYWLGVCLAPLNPKEALRHFERAFELFQGNKDLTGALRAWSGAINAVLVGWDDFSPLDSLIAWFYERADRITFSSVELEEECASSMAGAMVWRHPDHPDMGEWVARALNLTRRSENSALKLQACIYTSYYYIWVGDISNALLMEKEMREMTLQPAFPPLVLITSRWLQAGISYGAAGSYEAGLQAVSEALETAQTYGIHIWDHMIFSLGAYGSLLKGDRKSSSEFLDRMKATLRPDRSHGYCYYHYMAAWYSTLFDPSAALSHAELAVKLALEIRGNGLYFPEIICRLALANILCENRDYQAAGVQLAAVQDLIRRSRTKIMDFMYRFTAAGVLLAQGNEADGLAMLRSALELGRSQNYVTMLYWWQPTVMAALCQRAFEEGIEVDYVQDLVRRRKLIPENPPLHIEDWPWPLKIRTMGRFEMIMDGQVVVFSGKVPQKPLSLLKAIIAFSGREISDEQFSDALWPEAEGDAASLSFRTTLHRLRQLIGSEKVVQSNEGRTALAPQHCWVDVWAFQRLCEKAEVIWKMEEVYGKSADSNYTLQLCEKAMGLYKGEFLPGDRRQPWTLSMRERLKNKFVSLAGRTGDHYTKTAQWEKVIEFYQNALEVDDLQEEFYRRLMVSYQKLGRRAEALATYDRCRNILSSAFGIEPSPETEVLRESIRSARLFIQ